MLSGFVNSSLILTYIVFFWVSLISHCSSDLHYSLLRKRNEFVDLPDFKIDLLDFVIAFYIMYGHTWQKNAHILKNVGLSFPIYPDKRTYLRLQQFKLFEFKIQMLLKVH